MTLVRICLILGAIVPGVTAAARPQSGTLPPPTGPFAVGQVELDWTDSARPDPFPGRESHRRDIVVFAWYPAASAAGHLSPYVPHLERIRAAIGDSGMRGEFRGATELVLQGGPRTHEFAAAPLSRADPSYPVLVFSPGFGESVLTYRVMLEDLASHGYVVLGLEHPHDAYAVALDGGEVIPFPDAAWNTALKEPGGAAAYQLAQVPIRSADIAFVIARIREGSRSLGILAGHLDQRRLGAFGHSLGGLAAADACAMDPRIRACMNQDAEFKGLPFLAGDSGNITQPFLFFATDHSLYERPNTTPPSDQDLSAAGYTRAGYDSLMHGYRLAQEHALAALPGGAIRIIAETRGFGHRSFMDLNLLGATDSTAAAQALAGLELVRWYTRVYFDRVVKGGREMVLEATPPKGVTVERF